MWPHTRGMASCTRSRGRERAEIGNCIAYDVGACGTNNQGITISECWRRRKNRVAGHEDSDVLMGRQWG